MEEEQLTPKKPEKVSISARLEALGDDKKRPQTALVAENLESIERAIERGIPMTSIWKALQEEGFTLTFRSFESALYRLRKKKAAQTSNTNANSPKMEAKPASPEGHSNKAHNPQEPPPGQPEEEDEETRAIQEFKKSISHLPAVQQGKKMGDFLEKLQENKMSPSTRRWLGDKK